jgi:hypothetical protein
MATTFRKYVTSLTTPDQMRAREAATARALVNDAREKARISATYRESYARGLSEYERAVAESRARQQERRQGGTPDAVSVESKTAEVMHIDFDEDSELHCAMCDSENITLGARHGADELGVEDSEDAAWCWDCSAVTEAVEIALPAATLRRIYAAVAA